MGSLVEMVPPTLYILLNKMHKPHIPNIAFSTKSHTPFVEELFAIKIHCMMVRASPGKWIRVRTYTVEVCMGPIVKNKHMDFRADLHGV